MDKIVEALNRLTEAVEEQTRSLGIHQNKQDEFFDELLLHGLCVNVNTDDIANAISALDKSLSEPGAKKQRTRK
jgi:hypothetical protein